MDRVLRFGSPRRRVARFRRSGLRTRCTAAVVHGAL